MIRNTIKVIEQTHKKINERYDMRQRNILDIESHNSNKHEMIIDSFVFGYAQGMKAAKAEMKRSKEAAAV